jgi:hypothetical protein
MNHRGGQKMPAIKRVSSERRSGKDRRRIFSLHRFLYKGPEKRVLQDRRSQVERRDGWVRISKWSSVEIRELKIAKYVH